MNFCLNSLLATIFVGKWLTLSIGDGDFLNSLRCHSSDASQRSTAWPESESPVLGA